MITGCGPIYVDLFSQKKIFPPGFGLTLKFFPVSNNFFIMSGVANPDEVYTITDMSLYYRKMELSHSLCSAIASGMKQTPSIYPIKRYSALIFEAPAGTTLINRTLASFSQVPEAVILGIASSTALNGNYVKNPFNFVDKKCQEASLYVDGKRVPNIGFNPNYDARDKHQAYRAMLDFVKNNGLGANGVTYDDFMTSGNGVWIFNVLQSQPGSSSPQRNGSLSFKLLFPTGAVDEAVCIIVIQIFSNNVYMNDDKTCQLDWQ